MSHSLTYNDMLGAYQPYPAPIRPYLLRAQSHPLLSSLLTKSFMRVFIDILARAPIASPLKPLWLRVDVIAKALNLSTKTVSRAIGFLMKQGWLIRHAHHDGRNNWGEFCAKEYVLGDELRNLLGFPTQHSSEETATLTQKSDNNNSLNPVDNDANSTYFTEQIVDKNAIGTKMSDGLYKVNKVFKKEASFKEASELKTQKTEKQTSYSQKPSTQSINAMPTLPTELIEMSTTLDIHPFGICSLMRLAKQVGQRLQDLWKAKQSHLLTSGAKAGRAYRYVEFLIQTGEDFAFRANTMTLAKSNKKPITLSNKTNFQHEAVVPLKVSSDRDVRLYWNKRFIDGRGSRIRIHGDGSGEIQSSTRHPIFVASCDMAPIYHAIEVGKLWLEEA